MLNKNDKEGLILREKDKKAKMMPEEYFVAIIISIMLFLCFFNVVTRYLFSKTILIADALLSNMFPWVTFIGAAVTCYYSKNTAFTMLTDLLPKKYQKFVDLFTLITSWILFGFLFYFGCIKVKSYMDYQTVIPSMRNAPRWIFSLCLPIGSACCLVRCTQVFIMSLKGKGKPGEEKVESVVTNSD